MNATLTIFQNCTPNGQGGIHYAPIGKDTEFNPRFFQWLKENYTYKVLTANTYRIYGDYIDIPAGTFLNPNTATYAVIASDNDAFFNFYFISSIQLISAGLRLFITPDYWATYISTASITNLAFSRTNLRLNVMSELAYIVPTNPRTVNIDYSFVNAFANRQRVARRSLNVIAILKYPTQISTSEESEEVRPYAFTIYDLPTDESGGVADTEENFRKLLTVVGSIYEINYNQGVLKAEVMHVYIVEPVGERITAAQTFTGLYHDEKIKLTGTMLRPNIYELSQYTSIGNLAYTPNVVGVGAMLSGFAGETIYFGTKYNGITLAKIVGVTESILRFDLHNDELIVTAINGTESRDITNAFEEIVVKNTGSLTPQEQAAKWLGVLGNVAGGAFQMAAGGAGVVTGSLQIAQGLTAFLESGNGTYQGGGSAQTTFYDIIHDGVGEYVYITIAASYNDVTIDNYVKTEGASCMYRPGYDEEFLDFIATKGFILKNTPYIAIACIASVDNAPYNACDDIAATLADGVKIILI